MEYKNEYIKRLISRMTLDQKVGQMMTLGFAGVVAKKAMFTSTLQNITAAVSAFRRKCARSAPT